APTVGREHELALLAELWSKAASGEGQVVLLSGEPGIGKSHLIQALRERLRDRPHIRIRCQCSPFHANSALRPSIVQLTRAAGFHPDDPPSVKLDKLERLLARSTDKVRDDAPLLSAFLSLPVGSRYAPLNLSPQRQKELTLEALIRQLVGLAARQPVLLVFEDIHWIDPTSLELLDRLVPQIPRLAVLAIFSFRPEFEPRWIGHPRVTSLALNRLSHRQGAALVQRLTGGKALPGGLLEQMVAKTDGVPLFLEEVTKAVIESDVLTDEGDRYALAGPLPPLAIPATLQDSLVARLDRLVAPAREVAQIGAAIGREFSYELLAAVAQRGERELQGALDQLIGAELVIARGRPPHATCIFKHALVGDAAYATLLRSRRQQLHTRIAHALEQHFGEVVEHEPEIVAQHYTAAGLSLQAIGYW
ncbi:adenylate cyclase, partial [Mesorhizobium sp. M4A.F.Ca.ET.020.02.1.1]